MTMMGTVRQKLPMAQGKQRSCNSSGSCSWRWGQLQWLLVSKTFSGNTHTQTHTHTYTRTPNWALAAAESIMLQTPVAISSLQRRRQRKRQQEKDTVEREREREGRGTGQSEERGGGVTEANKRQGRERWTLAAQTAELANVACNQLLMQKVFCS